MQNSIFTFIDDLNLIAKLSKLKFNILIDDSINQIFFCEYNYNDYLDLLGIIDDLERENISNEFQLTYNNNLYTIKEFLNKFER